MRQSQARACRTLPKVDGITFDVSLRYGESYSNRSLGFEEIYLNLFKVRVGLCTDVSIVAVAVLLEYTYSEVYRY